jgi:hypothetical protein
METLDKEIDKAKEARAGKEGVEYREKLKKLKRLQRKKIRMTAAEKRMAEKMKKKTAAAE